MADRAELESLLNSSICAECGEGLAIFYNPETKAPFIACKRWDRNGHIKIGRQNEKINQYREESFFMAEQSLAVQNKLAKYQGIPTLNPAISKEIIVTLWPDAEKASPAEVYKAMMLCVQYGLNPLMNHLFLIPFDKYEGKGDDKKKIGTIFTCVLGIKANRLIASRKHKYTFLDDTPRIMSDDEQMKIYGKLQSDKIIFITKLKDLDTGAEATGRGEWKRSDSWGNPNNPKGSDKGNSQENMAAVRSERQAYDRLYPADMPDNSIPVVDGAYEDRIISGPTRPGQPNAYLTSDGQVIDGETGEALSQVDTPVMSQPPADTQTGTEQPAAENKGANKDFDKLESARTATGPGHSPPPKRDLTAIKTVKDMVDAVKKDFAVSPQQAMKEANVTSWNYLTIAPVEVYKIIASVR